MARPSTLPVFASVKAAHRAILTDPAVGLIARTKSGGEYTDLVRRMHTEDPRCVVCNLPTLFTRWDGPATATLGHLIPPAVIRDAHAETITDLMESGAVTSPEALRLGYVPGNLALFCRACIDASVTYSAAMGEPVVWGEGLAGLDRVPVSITGLRKCSRPALPTGDEFRAIARASDKHAAAAARARASQGLPF